MSESTAADVWAACRARLQRAPDDYESAYCFYDVAAQRGRWDDAARLFERLLQDHPGNFWLPLAFGHLHRRAWTGADAGEAERLYLRAAEGFRASRHARGEILSRINLRDLLAPQGRLEDAAAQVARVVEIGADVDDPELKAQVWMTEASHVLDTGGDLGHAYRLLKQVERAVFPAGAYRLQRTSLGWLGLVAFRLGRLDEAIGIFRRLETMAASAEDAQTQANAQYNILNVELAKENELPGAGGRERILTLARQTLARSVAASHTVTALKAHRVIAELLVNTPAARDEALQHATSCLDMAAAAGRAEDEALCAWVLARLQYATDPASARATQSRARAATVRASNPATEALTAIRHMQFSWASKPRHEAIADSLAALDAIETLRRLQDTARSSAEAFAIRTPEYYWLSGRLLQAPQSGDVERAFAIAERLRARALLDARTRSRTPLDETHPAVVEWRDALRAIAVQQRALMDPALPAVDRRTRLAQLEQLEEREQAAAHRIAVLEGVRPAAAHEALAQLADVQAALAPDEALLSFQVGNSDDLDGSFAGGSWLIVVTREGRFVQRIPDRSHFAPLVPVFTGLIERADGLESAAAVRLYEDLFAGVLSRLPAGIGRLIVIPDGPLHHLPFGALRAAAADEPLGVRYELQVIPSATLWIEWRRSRPREARRRVLALADPTVASRVPAAAAERHAVLQYGARLGQLPHARRESRAIARQLGDVVTLIGPLASEHQVKTRSLGDYRIVHFAAHALADAVRPERSAIFLAPGADAEDGLLQAREIGDLDFEGTIAVLSACETAAGDVLLGEGMLSLARSFFEAGARAVVGTRWRIRDEDAAWLFASFYRHLGAGASLSFALRQTRVDAIAAGRSAQAWAALIVIGDGAMQPFPDAVGSGAFPGILHLLALAGGALAAVGCMVFVRRSAAGHRADRS